MKQTETKLENIPIECSKFDQLPDAGFISQKTLLILFSTSRTTLWRCIRNKSFPESVPSVGTRSKRWNVGVIRSHLAQKVGAK